MGWKKRRSYLCAFYTPKGGWDVGERTRRHRQTDCGREFSLVSPPHVKKGEKIYFSIVYTIIKHTHKHNTVSQMHTHVRTQSFAVIWSEILKHPQQYLLTNIYTYTHIHTHTHTHVVRQEGGLSRKFRKSDNMRRIIWSLRQFVWAVSDDSGVRRLWNESAISCIRLHCLYSWGKAFVRRPSRLAARLAAFRLMTVIIII